MTSSARRRPPARPTVAWLVALAAALAAVAAGCAGQDVVAIDDLTDGGAPLYCQGNGPPILVGDGITVGEGNGSSDDVCSGEIAVRTFRHALCTCEGYVTSTRLDTDSFDSAAGPYTPGGVAGPVGIDGVLQTSAALAIGGDLTVAGGGGAALGGDLDVVGDLAVGGALGTAIAVTVGGDAAVAGSIDLAALTVAGTLTVPAGETIGAATLTTGATVRAPVTVEPPCACAPDDLIDIADFVLAHRGDNEDALLGLTPDRLTDYVGDTTLVLPCGRYYLGPVRGQGALTLRVTGRVAILVDGDVSLEAPLTVILDGDDAELDLLIGGLLGSTDAIVAGDPARPASTRIYVGGDGVINLAGGSTLAANLYAPRAAVSLSGGATVHGSLFVRRLEQSAPVTIHYDVDVLRADVGCF
ncbi:MAG: hypothetical protein H6709_24635 [Kofleriaceae bacterium]|nr:hypothetical protein [Kofleriaceae bacterium]MCB9575276.1 hypothetical protein [Kofleriaceae bacterium]